MAPLQGNQTLPLETWAPGYEVWERKGKQYKDTFKKTALFFEP